MRKLLTHFFDSLNIVNPKLLQRVLKGRGRWSINWKKLALTKYGVPVTSCHQWLSYAQPSSFFSACPEEARATLTTPRLHTTVR